MGMAKGNNSTIEHCVLPFITTFSSIKLVMASHLNTHSKQYETYKDRQIHKISLKQNIHNILETSQMIPINC